MTAITIAIKDIGILFKDKAALLTLMGTPLALTLVLGIALGAMWTSQAPPSLILYSNEDDGDLGSILFDEVFTIPELAEKFTLKPVTCITEASDKVQTGEATALIHIPSDFTANINSGDHTKVSLWGDPASTIRMQIIQAVVDRYAAELSTRYTIYQTLAEQRPSPELVEQTLASLDIQTIFTDGYDRTTTGPVVPPAIDYYAAAMGIMYLLFTAAFGAKRFVQERDDKTLDRILQAPVSYTHIILGKFLSMFAAGLCQFSIVIIATTLIFRVTWGEPISVVLFAVATVAAATGIGLLIAAISKSGANADAAGDFIVLGSSALGGSMLPLFGMPPLLQMLSKVTITSWAIQGFASLMIGKSITDILLPTAVLIGFAIVLTSTSVLILCKGGRS